MKQHKEFQYIYKRGKNIHSSSVVLFYLPQQSTKKVGFTATKKIGNAVKRNRAKRRLRALFLTYSQKLNDATYIFVAKKSISETSHHQLDYDFKKILKKSKSFQSE
ncbi:MAG: ribonuclease P protein component [Epsilonproteobacteria bacterium]|nr:ribonuclease P protein component [Campylobacterota bacterium]